MYTAVAYIRVVSLANEGGSLFQFDGLLGISNCLTNRPMFPSKCVILRFFSASPGLPHTRLTDHLSLAGTDLEECHKQSRVA